MTTALNRRRRIALLEWDAACERLRIAIAPQVGVIPPSVIDTAEAFSDVRRALGVLESSYGMMPMP